MKRIRTIAANKSGVEIHSAFALWSIEIPPLSYAAGL